MNFGAPRPSGPMGPREPMPMPMDGPPQRPSGAPPPCPRCELVKSQCTKTVLNYQKSHRKKMEALRTELKSSRQQVERLQGQLRAYKSAARLLPGVAAVLVGGWLLWRRLRGSPGCGSKPSAAPAPAAEPELAQAQAQAQAPEAPEVQGAPQ
ncbi:hypothetical protein TSOC_008548 [Tetrabaena socialis]|uniref:Uncharacterized protein n=1 Tax=Tetrabaena socialis TaxID=47790 RepID=A0A2J7ZY76_9CHLO|nr:hypothetical protein TSOC_008548 [Tetrabaena socialis]|eukprot:PNH05212.1 hypothetical protein TSOC_008548 [Tetrabaena socialis]